MQYLPPDNLAYPVLIALGSVGSGSGFFINDNDVLWLATAKHVICDQSGKSLFPSIDIVAYAVNSQSRMELSVDVSNLVQPIKAHPSADVAILRIAEIETIGIPQRKRLKLLQGVAERVGSAGGGKITGAPRAKFRAFAEVLVSNEVFIFGYPRSLGHQGSPIDLSRPLLRKGIVAGKDDANQTIILDCPVYQGNSGSMVIEVEHVSPSARHFHPIGVVTQFIPFIEEFQSIQFGTINTSVENSGYSIVIPMDRIVELLSP